MLPFSIALTRGTDNYYHLVMMNWFAEALNRELDHRGLASQADLARLVGKPTATISRWLRGVQAPAFKDLCEVAERLEWELDGISPAEDGRPRRTPVERPKVIGSLSGSDASLAGNGARELDKLEQIWSQSHYYRQVFPETLSYINVEGNAMEPDFPDGCLLVCGRPTKDKLDGLTPVIARVGSQVTFKLYRLTKDLARKWQVELIPINDSFNIQYHRPSDVQVDYIVIGSMDPWKLGPMTRSGRPLLRRIAD